MSTKIDTLSGGFIQSYKQLKAEKRRAIRMLAQGNEEAYAILEKIDQYEQTEIQIFKHHLLKGDSICVALSKARISQPRYKELRREFPELVIFVKNYYQRPLTFKENRDL